MQKWNIIYPALAGAMVIAMATTAQADGVFGPDAVKELAAACKGDETLDAALFLNTSNNTFVQSMKAGAEQGAADCNFNISVFDAEFDTSKQINQLEDATTSGRFEIFVVQPVDSIPITSSVEDAMNAGITVAITNSQLGGAEDRYPGTVTYVGHKEVAVGKQAGQMALDALGEECGKLMIVGGIAESAITKDRTEGFELAVAANPKCEIVANQPADFDEGTALSVTENLLQSHPDADLIYAHSDNMASGSVTALQSAGKNDVKVVSIGASEQGLKLIDEGKMHGTVFFRPYIQGQLPLVAAAAVVRGMSIDDIAPYYNDSGNQVITKENVSEFTAEW